ncbi:hypothetical protein [Myroides injenensis]|nr:hypothetical protein [Myroides injenensis]
MGRNTPANRKIVKDKIANKKKKEREAATNRKALLREIVNKSNAKQKE